jgi:hypothetical protein
MADIAEQVLSRLVEVCQGVQGIVAVARNVTDVASLQRPAIVVHDGTIQLADAPPNLKRSQLQLLELTPRIEVLLRAAAADSSGPLLSTYRVRLRAAVLNDAELGALPLEALRFDSSSVEPPTAMSKEPRMNVHFAFVFVES